MRSRTHKSTTSSRSPPARRPPAPFFRPPGPRSGPRPATFFQAKLRIGAPGDRFEQEADRVADRIVAGETAPEVQRMCTGCAEEAQPDGEVRRQPAQEQEETVQASPDGELRRQPAEEEEEPLQASPLGTVRRQPAEASEHEEERLVQTQRDGELRRQPLEEEEEMLQPSAASRGGSAGTSAPSAGPRLAAGIDGLRGGGQPLRPSERAFFEPRFGRDLSSVRLHTGPRSAELARSIDARAFTVGRNVVFGTEGYAPAERESRRLLAHELTHVVQQGGGSPVLRRKVVFDKPTYGHWDPIPRILKGKRDGGRTTPVIDGKKMPNAKKALELVTKAITPSNSTHNNQSGECSWDDFDTKLSAIVFVPTKPKGRGWRTYISPADIKDAQVAAACKKQRTVPVRMTGKPKNETIVTWVKSNEQEHIDDLKKAQQNHLDKYFTNMLAMQANDPDKNKCLGKLKKALGKKAASAAKKFVNAFLNSVATRDAGGAHDLINKIQVKTGCSRIRIISKTK